MKVSLNWLKEFIDLNGLTNEDIINKSVKAGFEVETYEYLGQGTNLIVGKVLECKDHPDSDHLHVTKVDIGTEVLDIVCGAPNCRQGIKVIVAQVGAKLPDGEIKAGVIRGEKSNGMLCSLLELGVSKDLLDDNSPSLTGIEELGDEFNIGDTNVLEKLGYDDLILDINIYANRPDSLAMFNMAKEMAAILDRPCKLPEYEGKSNVGNKGKFTLSSESKNCTHFLAKVVNSVVIKESPKWVKDKLRSNGVKAINNLVDISNLVMLETGQPLHFYDLRSNPNRNIIVKDDYTGNYTALDGIDYHIEKGDLMITSDNKPIGIAGIMGGDNTKILDDTTGLIIEAAAFDHAQIRRTANRLGLQTEAASRFAKGLDPYAQYKAMDRAVQLLIELADAKDFEETVEYGESGYTPYTVSETLEHLNSLIGKTYTTEDVVNVFNRLDFKPEVKGDEIIAHIPSYRSTDIKIREDLDEEIVRLTGFDDLEATLPKMPQTIGKLSPIQAIRRVLQRTLVNQGLNEVRTYTLVSEDDHDEITIPLGHPVELQSPLSDDRKYVRRDLLASMMSCVKYNLDHKNSNINLFEISKVYAEGDIEQERLGVILNGSLVESKIKHVSVKADFYVLKGLILSILDRLGFEGGRVQLVENDLDVKHFHPYQSCLLKIDNNVIAILGRIHPEFENKYKVSDIYFAEVVLDELATAKKAKVKCKEINKYPSIDRDISIVLKDDVKSSDVMKQIKKTGGNLVTDIKVFDEYKGEHIEDGYKSLSLSITYESKDSTLKVEDINPIHERILNELSAKFGANQR